MYADPLVHLGLPSSYIMERYKNFIEIINYSPVRKTLKRVATFSGDMQPSYFLDNLSARYQAEPLSLSSERKDKPAHDVKIALKSFGLCLKEVHVP